MAILFLLTAHSKWSRFLQVECKNLLISVAEQAAAVPMRQHGGMGSDGLGWICVLIRSRLVHLIGCALQWWPSWVVNAHCHLWSTASQGYTQLALAPRAVNSSYRSPAPLLSCANDPCIRSPGAIFALHWSQLCMVRALADKLPYLCTLDGSG